MPYRNLLRPTALLSLAIALVCALLTGPLSAQVGVGQQAPDFTLTDQDGRTHRLADYRGRVVVIEWTNPNCPFSVHHARQGTMAGLARQHPQAVLLAINSTSRHHRDYVDPAAQQAFNAEHGIRHPVLFDTDGRVARAYGASNTPHLFVLDEQGRLLYQGAIDDDPYGRKPTATNYVGQALAAHAAGRAPEPATSRPYGCTVKQGD